MEEVKADISQGVWGIRHGGGPPHAASSVSLGRSTFPSRAPSRGSAKVEPLGVPGVQGGGPYLYPLPLLDQPDDSRSGLRESGDGGGGPGVGLPSVALSVHTEITGGPSQTIAVSAQSLLGFKVIGRRRTLALLAAMESWLGPIELFLFFVACVVGVLGLLGQAGTFANALPTILFAPVVATFWLLGNIKLVPLAFDMVETWFLLGLVLCHCVLMTDMLGDSRVISVWGLFFSGMMIVLLLPDALPHSAKRTRQLLMAGFVTGTVYVAGSGLSVFLGLLPDINDREISAAGSRTTTTSVYVGNAFTITALLLKGAWSGIRHTHRFVFLRAPVYATPVAPDSCVEPETRLSVKEFRSLAGAGPRRLVPVVVYTPQTVATRLFGKDFAASLFRAAETWLSVALFVLFLGCGAVVALSIMGILHPDFALGTFGVVPFYVLLVLLLDVRLCGLLWKRDRVKLFAALVLLDGILMTDLFRDLRVIVVWLGFVPGFLTAIHFDALPLFGKLTRRLVISAFLVGLVFVTGASVGVYLDEVDVDDRELSISSSDDDESARTTVLSLYLSYALTMTSLLVRIGFVAVTSQRCSVLKEFVYLHPLQPPARRQSEEDGGDIHNDDDDDDDDDDVSKAWDPDADARHPEVTMDDRLLDRAPDNVTSTPPCTPSPE